MNAAAEDVMELFPAAAVPGRRIEGYRNSMPRRIRLIGLGEQGTRIAGGVAIRSNVDVMTSTTTLGWEEIVGDQPGERIDMIVLVCGEADQDLFRAGESRPDMLVTFIVLKEARNLWVAADTLITHIRGGADLFVTTSDTQYVHDLVDNLAS